MSRTIVTGEMLLETLGQLSLIISGDIQRGKILLKIQSQRSWTKMSEYPVSASFPSGACGEIQNWRQDYYDPPEDEHRIYGQSIILRIHHLGNGFF